jgi:uncharacterized membrane protein YcaP (DUF421 family)
VLKKPEYRQITRKDLSLASPANIRFPIELIMDGQVISENIAQDDMSPEWLSKQLEIRNLSLDEVFYAVKGTNGNLYFDLYKDPIKHPIDIE